MTNERAGGRCNLIDASEEVLLSLYQFKIHLPNSSMWRSHVPEFINIGHGTWKFYSLSEGVLFYVVTTLTCVINLEC